MRYENTFHYLGDREGPMILEHAHLDIDEKVVFETIRLTDGFQKTNAMPNEACYLQILQGSYNSISESEQLIVHQNQGVLMKCGNYLCRMMVNPDNNEYQAIAIHFYPEIMRKIYKDALPDFMSPQAAVISRPAMTVISVTQLLNNCMDSIRIYFKNPAMATEEVIALKVKEIVLLLLQTENAPQIKEVFHSLFSPREFTMKEIIDSHMYLDTTLDELAQLCYMSSSTFKREFKKVFSDTPAHYIRLKKLERAASLIQTTSSITEIAFTCGFNDSSQFSKLFKSHFGVPPSKYQRDN